MTVSYAPHIGGIGRTRKRQKCAEARKPLGSTCSALPEGVEKHLKGARGGELGAEIDA